MLDGRFASVRAGDQVCMRAQSSKTKHHGGQRSGFVPVGAIRRSAGPHLLEHNKTLGGCPTGLAKITPGFNLEKRGIRHIIHAMGPVWHGDPSAKLGEEHADVLLAFCYQQCLELARTHRIKTIVFPAISTGVYHFPKDRTAVISVGGVLERLNKNDLPT